MKPPDLPNDTISLFVDVLFTKSKKGNGYKLTRKGIYFFLIYGLILTFTILRLLFLNFTSLFNKRN